MSEINSVAVFCGSRSGNDPAYRLAAQALGQGLAEAGIRLVYGGGRVGLMGVLADAALAAGGQVTGVMTRALVDSEIAHGGLTTLRVVGTMHERKTAMADLSDAFVALPGGPGTMEEMFEQWTWAMLGLHAKPCGFLDVTDYFAPLRAMVENMVGAGFLRRDHADMVAFEPDMDRLLGRFETYDPPPRKYA